MVMDQKPEIRSRIERKKTHSLKIGLTMQNTFRLNRYNDNNAKKHILSKLLQQFKIHSETQLAITTATQKTSQ